MDRPISQTEIKARRRRRILIATSCVAGAGLLIFTGLSLMENSLKASDLTFASPEMGNISVTVSGSGQVEPAYEEVIVSPITSRIEQVYLAAGDSVEAGTPLMRLDLLNTEAELSSLADRIAMQEHEVDQQRLNNSTRLSDLKMQAEVKEMALRRLEVELSNERYLDSIGSGTGDRVRQAELAASTARLELTQLRQLIANESKIADATIGIKELERSIAARNLEQMRRTLDNARITSPRRGTLTWINNNPGEQVAEGGRLAVVSDLGSFKVKGQIPDAYASKVSVGARATVTVGKKELQGTVSNVTPLSSNGVISYEVTLDNPSDPALHSGLKTDIYIIYGNVDETLRLPRSAYYSGPGTYDLFVRDGSHINIRKVTLGESNYRWVEVVDGLRPGEEVVISDMAEFRNAKSIKLK